MPRNSIRERVETPQKAIAHETASDNIFADVGLPEGDLAKADLVAQLDIIISEKEYTQVEVARILGIDQPRVSSLLRGKLHLFSLEKLLEFTTKLGNEVELVIRPSVDPHLTVQVGWSGLSVDAEQYIRCFQIPIPIPSSGAYVGALTQNAPSIATMLNRQYGGQIHQATQFPVLAQRAAVSAHSHLLH
jgi:predicted XRE-type DNA-binding protein